MILPVLNDAFVLAATNEKWMIFHPFDFSSESNTPRHHASLFRFVAFNLTASG